MRIELHSEGEHYKISAFDGLILKIQTNIRIEDVQQGLGISIGNEPLSLNKAIETYANSGGALKYPAQLGEFLNRILTVPVLDELVAFQDQHGAYGANTQLAMLPAELRRLPWELLSYKGRVFFRRDKSPISLCTPHDTLPLGPCEWPLRMLIMVGDSSGQIKCPDEVWEIRRAIGRFALRIDIATVYPKNAREATEYFQKYRPHLFHFVGHANAAGLGGLDLKSDAGSVPWTRQDIVTTLDGLDGQLPRLVVLNACRTSGPDGADGNDSVSEIFLRAGCNVVIGTRQNFGAAAALVFASGFYSKLAEFGLHQADRAYCHAVNQVALINNASIDWSTPRMYVQRNWQVGLHSSDQLCHCAAADTQHGDLRKLRTFINRDSERDKLYHEVSGWLKNPDPPFVAVSGHADSGKSWLLRALVFAAKLKGWRAIYVDPQGLQGDLESVLDYMRTGDPAQGYLSQPLDLQLGGQHTPFVNFESLRKQPVANAGDENPKAPLLASFRDSLSYIGNNVAPVLVALDQVESLDTNACWRYLRDDLIKPIIASGTGKVAFAIAVRSGDTKTLGLDQLTGSGQPPPIELNSYLTENYDELLTTLFQREVQDETKYRKYLPVFLKVIDVFSLKTRPSFELKKLQEVYNTAHKLVELQDVR